MEILSKLKPQLSVVEPISHWSIDISSIRHRFFSIDCSFSTTEILEIHCQPCMYVVLLNEVFSVWIFLNLLTPYTSLITKINKITAKTVFIWVSICYGPKIECKCTISLSNVVSKTVYEKLDYAHKTKNDLCSDNKRTVMVYYCTSLLVKHDLKKSWSTIVDKNPAVKPKLLKSRLFVLKPLL
jgi:hypothetical protein